MPHDQTPQPPTPQSPALPLAPPYRVGCVSYLNAAPLIDGLEHDADLVLERVVPSGLLNTLLTNTAHLALCPVIDFFTSPIPLRIIPVGGIGSEGPTLTVRLFSRCPIPKITHLHVDTDSHTSVVLVQVLLRECFGISPTIEPYQRRSTDTVKNTAQSMLLIGDKVVTDSPLAIEYPYQLDLGEAWHQQTGLPFVFATWMARTDTALGNLPQRLAAQRDANLKRVDQIAQRLAHQHGWPIELAEHYFRDVLRYTVDARELEAIQRFGELAHIHRLIELPGQLPFVSPEVTT